jgi:hypothetical protein
LGDPDAYVVKLKPAGDGTADQLYSTYLGGSAYDYAYGVAVDDTGNIYLAGNTNSSNFPTTPNAYQTTLQGSYDLFIAKINPAGGGASDLLYSTYVGKSAFNYDYGIEVDGSGNAYVAGYTTSALFPTTTGAYQTAASGSHAFVAELSPAGGGASDLLYGTYLGGNGGDYAQGMAMDSSHHVYLTGYTTSTNFPTTANAYQVTGTGTFSVFFSKFQLAGTGSGDLLYSTSIGGNNYAFGYAIAVDTEGKAYLTGYTFASNYPTTTNAYQTLFSGAANTDAFLTVLNPAGAGSADLVYSTYLGTPTQSVGNAVALDSSGTAWIGGWTTSSTFPTTADAYQTSLVGSSNAILAGINPAGEGASDLVYSTYLGEGGEQILGLAGDGSGDIFATGGTSSSTFPTTTGAYQTTYGGNGDGFVVEFGAAPTATATLSSTSTPFVTITPTNSPTFTATATTPLTSTPTFTATVTPTLTASGTATPTFTNSIPIDTSTLTPTATVTSTVTGIPTDTPTDSPTPTTTASPTYTATVTPTASMAVTPSLTASPTPTASPSPTESTTSTPADTSTATPTPSLTGTATFPPTATDSPTQTPTDTMTGTPTPSITSTNTNSSTFTATFTLTASPTPTSSPGSQPTLALTATPTPGSGVVWGLPYPNPVHGLGPVTVPMQVPEGSTVEWSVFTTAFRKILDTTNPILGDQFNLVWNLEDAWQKPVAGGLYYLRVQVTGPVKASRVLKVVVLR